MQKHTTEIFGKQVLDNQDNTMADSALQFSQGKKCQKCAERYFDINGKLLYHRMDAKKFSGKNLNKQLFKKMPV